MTELRELCAAFDVDEDAAREVLRKDRSAAMSALTMPWYVRAIVGFGAWITALVAIVLGAMILVAIGAESEISLAVLGAVFFVPAMWLLREVEQQVYATHLGIAVAAAGIAMITAGVGLQAGEFWAATIVSAVLTGAVILLGRHQSLQFLAATLTAILFLLGLIDDEVPHFIDIAAGTGLVAVYLLLQPPRRNVQSTAIVLLLTMPVFGIFHGFGMRAWIEVAAGGWVARIAYVAVFLWLAYVHWQRESDESTRYRLSIFAAAAVIVGLLLPPGGSASLVIIMLGFILGSRPLAVLGVFLQIFYLWRFYYDIEATLLTKSYLLMLVGVVLIAAWWLMQRRGDEEESA